jgi:hypothetical protein
MMDSVRNPEFQDIGGINPTLYEHHVETTETQNARGSFGINMGQKIVID